jgi:glycosyltransferase involved in cell wall biosynthesis
MTSDLSAETPAFVRQLHVAFLVNFVAPNHRAVLSEVQRHVGKLSILSSVEMESNREFEHQNHDLDIIVQKTHTITRTARHPSGYEDVNYVHIPLDMIGQLRRLRPDVIVSLELGARTIASVAYRLLNRRCAVVAAVCASERSEAGRGFVRRLTRGRLLRRVDWVTFNGPSCRQYLLGLGARPDRMSVWDYSADPTKIYRGPSAASYQPNRLRLVTVGQLSKRKGVIEAIAQLAAWADANPQQQIVWNILGNGPLESEMRAVPVQDNLQINFHGHCRAEVIPEHYRDNDFMLFPTLGDEWGLVVDESLHSGLPVIGSMHSQAVTSIIQDGDNGWRFDPEVPGSLAAALNHAIRQSPERRLAMIESSRASVANRTPVQSAAQFLSAVHQAASSRR